MMETVEGGLRWLQAGIVVKVMVRRQLHEMRARTHAQPPHIKISEDNEDEDSEDAHLHTTLCMYMNIHTYVDVHCQGSTKYRDAGTKSAGRLAILQAEMDPVKIQVNSDHDQNTFPDKLHLDLLETAEF